MAPISLGSRLLCRGENFGDENLPAARLKRRVPVAACNVDRTAGGFERHSPDDQNSRE